jgi:hypothetical protein
MGKLAAHCRSLGRDTAGSILPMAASGILVCAAVIGSGVDLSRAYKAQNRLQAACDAGVLAGRHSVASDGFNDVAQAKADTYFDANFDDADQQTHDTSFEATSADNGITVNGTASTSLDTAIMKIFGVNDFTLSVDCTASMGVGNSDIVMVLDTTGSMLDEANGTDPEEGDTTKLEDLQAAMKNFYDTVAASSDGSNARIRYGFVPYSSSVNVGHLIHDLNPGFLVDTVNVQSRQWVAWGTPVTSSGTGYTTTLYDRNWTRITTTSYGTEAACLTAKPADTAWANFGTESHPNTQTEYINDSAQRVTRTTVDSQEQRSTVYSCIYRSSNNKYFVNWKRAYRDFLTYEYETSDATIITDPDDDWDGLLYRQVEYNTSSYKNFNAISTLVGLDNDAPELVSSTWAGCIEERQTVATGTFTASGDAISPEGALDLNIDLAPDISDDATKWAPLWPELSYYRSSSAQFSFEDPNDNGFNEDKASAACPYESRLLGEMEEDDFDDYADSLVARGSTYHDIGMIWGARLASPEGLWDDLVNEEPGNGGTVSRHIIFMTDGIMQPSTTTHSSYGIERNDKRVTDDGSSSQTSRHNARFLALCEAVKSKGIRVWVIAFGTSLTTQLQTCASSDSSYTASSSAQLNTAFQEIAKQVGELRVTL